MEDSGEKKVKNKDEQRLPAEPQNIPSNEDMDYLRSCRICACIISFVCPKPREVVISMLHPAKLVPRNPFLFALLSISF